MAYKFMTYEEKEEIGILTLNRPEKRNALGQEFEEEIISCLQDAGKRCDAKVIILKAEGEIFCAGHDRMEILNQPLSDIRRLFQTSFNLMTAIRNAPQFNMTFRCPTDAVATISQMASTLFAEPAIRDDV